METSRTTLVTSSIALSSLHGSYRAFGTDRNPPVPTATIGVAPIPDDVDTSAVREEPPQLIEQEIVLPVNDDEPAYSWLVCLCDDFRAE